MESVVVNRLATPQEREFNLHGFRYAGQYWNAEGGIPALALHGWLDNSASFSVLAPLLDGVQLLALDLAGHGHTDHRVGLSDYPIWSETNEIFAIADAMGWQKFALIGHSRGAMMSTIAASVFPERISHLILLDSLIPPPIEANKASARIAKGNQEIHRRIKRKTSCYPTYEDAIQARCQSEFGKLSSASSELLATRGLTQLEAGYNWHADGKLWASANPGLTAEQIESFITNVTAKTLLLLAESNDELNARTLFGPSFESFSLTIIDQLKADVQRFDGGHHLHMESTVDKVAQSIQRFLFEQ